jgi:hypothetical protein
MAGENEGDKPAGGNGAGDQGGGSAGDALDAVIGAYVNTARQLPGVIPELITGKTLNEVNASIDTAKAAFARVAGQVGGQAAGSAGSGGTNSQAAPAPAVGSGSSGQTAIGRQDDGKVTSDSAYSKILAGIEGRGKQSR